MAWSRNRYGRKWPLSSLVKQVALGIIAIVFIYVIFVWFSSDDQSSANPKFAQPVHHDVVDDIKHIENQDVKNVDHPDIDGQHGEVQQAKPLEAQQANPVDENAQKVDQDAPQIPGELAPDGVGQPVRDDNGEEAKKAAQPWPVDPPIDPQAEAHLRELMELNKPREENTDKGRVKVTDLVFLDITIGGEPAGRIEIGLFGHVVPDTVKNFKSLAEGFVMPDGSKSWYKNTKFHRVIKDFVIQGGNFGGKSIWGGHFKDENFDILHYGSGWVAMANAGKDTNAAQFYITLNDTPWLNGGFVVFGKVVKGMGTVRKVENLQTNNSLPLIDAVISDCGSLPMNQHFMVEKNNAVEPEKINTDEAEKKDA